MSDPVTEGESRDLVIPNCSEDEMMEVLGAFSIYTFQLMEARAMDRLHRLNHIQERMIDENTELLRDAVLGADPDSFMWVPKAHDTFLEKLELVVVNGELRDGRKTIIYEEDGLGDNEVYPDE